MPAIKKSHNSSKNSNGGGDGSETTPVQQPQQSHQMPTTSAPAPVVPMHAEPVPGSIEYNNRALAIELDKLRQVCQMKDERIIELNAANFEQREDTLRMTFACEEAREHEREMFEKLQASSAELDRSKRYSFLFTL